MEVFIVIDVTAGTSYLLATVKKGEITFRTYATSAVWRLHLESLAAKLLANFTYYVSNTTSMMGASGGRVPSEYKKIIASEIIPLSGGVASG